jgi:hypothetical protein
MFTSFVRYFFFFFLKNKMEGGKWQIWKNRTQRTRWRNEKKYLATRWWAKKVISSVAFYYTQDFGSKKCKCLKYKGRHIGI